MPVGLLSEYYNANANILINTTMLSHCLEKTTGEQYKCDSSNSSSFIPSKFYYCKTQCIHIIHFICEF